jgi:hypothetical protein
VRRALAVLAALAVVLAGAAGCRAPKDDASGTAVVRTKVHRVTGTAADTPAEAGAPGEPGEGACRHAWRALDRETHLYYDTGGAIPLTALCTPIRCDKSGLVRHECVRLRRARR